MVFYWFDNYRMHTPNFLSVKNILISGVGNHYIILVFLAIKAGASWYGVETKKDELLRSKDETELEIYQYQLQPKLVHTLVEELETVSTQKPGKTSEMIIRISEFLNDFLYEGKEDLIPLQLEVELLNNFMEIHKQALGDRIKSNFIVAGNLKSVVIPPLLLLPFINSAIKIAYECNKIFESTVLIKVEKKYLLFSFSFWSDDEFGIDDDENIRITRKRLKYSFPGKYRLIENIDSNFREFSLEIFS